MFNKKTLAYYENNILQGKLFLVRNRLLEKYTEWRYWGEGFSSDDAYKAHVLVFYLTHQHFEVGCQRYEFVSGSAYKKSTVGQQYYLVLEPQKADPAKVTVIDIFPCATTTLTATLRAAMERDAAHTGFPVSLETEKRERNAWYDKCLQDAEDARRKRETPEETAIRIKEEKDQAIFAEITNNTLKKCGYFFLMPLIILGCILLLFMPLLGMVCIFGGCFLFLLITLLMLAFKKPLIAMKKRRLGIDE